MPDQPIHVARDRLTKSSGDGLRSMAGSIALLCFVACSSSEDRASEPPVPSGTRWHDALSLGIEGKGWTGELVLRRRVGRQALFVDAQPRQLRDPPYRGFIQRHGSASMIYAVD